MFRPEISDVEGHQFPCGVPGVEDEGSFRIRHIFQHLQKTNPLPGKGGTVLFSVDILLQRDIYFSSPEDGQERGGFL